MCDGLRAALSVSVNQLTARHGTHTSLAVQFVTVRRDNVGRAISEGPDSDRHLSNKSIIHVKHINTSEMLLVVTWFKDANEKQRTEKRKKKPKLNYPMFTISLQISTLALHSNTHRQTPVHNHNHIQAKAASFKSFIRCTHKTNANKAPCQIKRSKQHP